MWMPIQVVRKASESAHRMSEASELLSLKAKPLSLRESPHRGRASGKSGSIIRSQFVSEDIQLE
jgi:hypothetical protein